MHVAGSSNTSPGETTVPLVQGSHEPMCPSACKHAVGRWSCLAHISGDGSPGLRVVLHDCVHEHLMSACLPSVYGAAVGINGPLGTCACLACPSPCRIHVYDICQAILARMQQDSPIHSDDTCSQCNHNESDGHHDLAEIFNLVDDEPASRSTVSDKFRQRMQSEPEPVLSSVRLLDSCFVSSQFEPMYNCATSQHM